MLQAMSALHTVVRPDRDCRARLTDCPQERADIAYWIQSAGTVASGVRASTPQ